MHSSTLPNNDPANIVRVYSPSIPVVDWQPIRGTLGAFRASYDEIEQFVGQLLDEIDVAWQELDAEWTRVESNRGTTIDATIEASTGTALVPACSAIGELQSDEALVRRIAELEEDRFALQAEVEFTRTQLAEQTKLLFDERRLAADERASWASEMRLLREAIHRQMDTSPAPPNPSDSAPAAPPIVRLWPAWRTTTPAIPCWVRCCRNSESCNATLRGAAAWGRRNRNDIFRRAKGCHDCLGA